MKQTGNKNLLSKIRQTLADYMYSEGCSCCQDVDEHKLAKDKLGKLLKIKKYLDNSGYDFSKYRSPK